jgi:hypothetical protein
MAKIGDGGVVFTAALGLFALAVLSLTAMAVSHMQEMRDNVYVSSSMERAYSESEAAEDDIRDIIARTSGVGVSVSHSAVTFQEELPNPHAATFRRVLASYGQFIGQHSTLQLDTSALANTLTLAISPSGVNYTHIPYGGGQLALAVSRPNVDRYSVTVSSGINITNCSWTNPLGNNTLTLDIMVSGNPGSCSRTMSVDPALGSRLDVNAGAMYVTVLGGGLSVVNSMASAVNVSTTAYLTDASDDIISVQAPGVSLSASLPQYGIIRRPGIRVI